MKRAIATLLITVAALFTVVGCKADTSGDYQQQQHGFIYVPKVGKSPGFGPIIY